MGVLVRITASTLNSTFCRSVMEKSLAKLMSSDLYPGPRNAPTGQLPNVPAAGAATAAGFRNWNPWAGLAGLTGRNGKVCGTPGTQLGRVENPLVPDVSELAKMV